MASLHSSSPIQEMLSKPGADPVLSFSSKMLLGAELPSTCNTVEVLSISLCCNGLGQNRLKHICYLVLFNCLWNCAYYSSQRSQIPQRSRAPHTSYSNGTGWPYRVSGISYHDLSTGCCVTISCNIARTSDEWGWGIIKNMFLLKTRNPSIGI